MPEWPRLTDVALVFARFSTALASRVKLPLDVVKLEAALPVKAMPPPPAVRPPFRVVKPVIVTVPVKVLLPAKD